MKPASTQRTLEHCAFLLRCALLTALLLACSETRHPRCCQHQQLPGGPSGCQVDLVRGVWLIGHPKLVPAQSLISVLIHLGHRKPAGALNPRWHVAPESFKSAPGQCACHRSSPKVHVFSSWFPKKPLKSIIIYTS